MLRAPRLGPPPGAEEAIGRVPGGFGWFGLGALAAGATAWAIFSRTQRSPSDGQEPHGREPDDGQEPDVVLDVPELEVDRISLEVRDLRAHVSILAELANLVNISVGVDARLDEVNLEIEGVEAEVHLVARLKNVRAILEKALDTIGEHPEAEPPEARRYPYDCLLCPRRSPCPRCPEHRLSPSRFPCDRSPS